MIFADYTGRITAEALTAADIDGACRYLSWLPNDKVMNVAEFWSLYPRKRVVANWEYDEFDWLGGSNAALQHATEAIRQLQTIGYPVGQPVPGSADFDMTRTQWTTAGKLYASTWATTIKNGGYWPGVYGSWDVLSWCTNELPWFNWWTWQSMSHAYSGGRNANEFPGVNLRQRPQQTIIAGVQVDINDVINDWSTVGTYPNFGEPTGINHRSDSEMIADIWGAACIGKSPWDGAIWYALNGIAKDARTAATQQVQLTLTDAQLQTLKAGLADGVAAALKPLIDQLRHRIADAEAQAASTLAKD